MEPPQLTLWHFPLMESGWLLARPIVRFACFLVKNLEWPHEKWRELIIYIADKMISRLLLAPPCLEQVHILAMVDLNQVVGRKELVADHTHS